MTTKKQFIIPITIICLLLSAIALSISHNSVAAQAFQYDAGQWTVNYYNNPIRNPLLAKQTIPGSPDKLQPINLSLDWGKQSPTYGVPADRFTAQLFREVRIAHTGIYRIQGRADDSLTFTIDDRRIVSSSAPWAEFDEYVQLDEGYHKLRIDYTEWVGSAFIDLKMSYIKAPPELTVEPITVTPSDLTVEPIIVTPSDLTVEPHITKTPTPTPKYATVTPTPTATPLPVIDISNVWKVTYRNNLTYLDNAHPHPVTSIERGTMPNATTPGGIRLDWGTHAPIHRIERDHFTTRIEGTLYVQQAGNYKLNLNADDTAQLYINSERITSVWGAWQSTTKTVYLEAGEHPVRIDHFEWVGYSFVDFSAVLID